MGIRKASFGLVFLGVAMAILACNVAAQGPASAPSPTEDCSIVIAELIDCLPFASGAVPRPPATCCSNLTAVVSNDPICLCQLFNASFIDPSSINLTRAQQLPTFCNVSALDPSLCSLVGVPVSAPVPLSPVPVSPVTAPTPSASTPSQSAPSGTPSAVPLPSTPSAGPIGVPPIVNTTGPPAPPPNSAPALAFSFSAVALLLVHLIVH